MPTSLRDRTERTAYRGGPGLPTGGH